MNADQICYLEAGEIVERGSIPDLIATEGKFKRLYDVQFGGHPDVT
jgi:ATP-binding cassette subfamily B protein